MQKAVFVQITLPLIAGIALFYNQGNGALLYLKIALALLLAILCGLNLGYRRFKAYRLKPFIAFSFYVLSFLLGGILSIAHNDQLKPDYFGNQSGEYLKVRIADEPQLKNNIIRFKCTVLQCFNKHRIAAVSGALLVSVRKDSSLIYKLNYGDELVIPAIFKAVPPPLNPYQFDVKSWLGQQNIYHQSYLKGNEIERTAVNTGNQLMAYALNLRKEQIAIYRKFMKNDEAYAVASTLILGYRSDLSAETLQAYSKTGTIHALSVSGMHVGIIFVVLNYLLAKLDRNTAGKIFKFLLILFLIWYYALITGLSPSVLRSVIMLSVYVFAKTTNRTSNTYNIIAFSAFCILLVNPYLLFDVGFQLSYLSVTGLVFLQPKIKRWVHTEKAWLNKLWDFISLSVAAQLATFPFALYYFHQFPVYFLLSNLFILLPVTGMMYLGLGILLFRLDMLFPMFEWCIVFTNGGLKVISGLPFSTLSEIWINKWELLILVMALTILTFSLIHFKKKPLMAALFMILMISIRHMLKEYRLSKQEKIVFFSLPNNYATAYIMGNTARIQTDLDSKSTSFNFYIKPALDAYGIRNFQTLKIHQEYRSDKLILSAHQIVFMQKHILLADSCFRHMQINNPQQFDLIWLSSPVKLDVTEILNRITTRRILLDGRNKWYFEKKYTQEAKIFKVPVYNLKKLKAYLINR